jgi:hypothetical protein
MGILDSIKNAVGTAVDNANRTYNPVRKVEDALQKAIEPSTSTPEQKSYEAQEKEANKNNPSYGSDAPVQRVDDSIKRMP